MSSVGRLLYHYLSEVTDVAVRDLNPTHMPVVGLSSRLMRLLSINKGMYILEAHTGGGKTTFGRMLYHMAKRGLLHSDVIYIDASEMRRYEGLPDEHALMKRLEDVMFRPKSYADKGYVMTSSTRDYVEEVKSFDEALGRLEGANVIVVVDELEKAAAQAITSQDFIPKWALSLRRHFNRTGRVPMKIILLLTKVLALRETLMNCIRREGEDVRVFTEVRDLGVSQEVLEDYLSRLNSHFKELGLRKDLVGDVVESKSLKRLASLLSNLKNGRYIFPTLFKSIADAVERYLEGSNVSVSSISDLIAALNDANGKPIEIDVGGYVDEALMSVVNRRYYGIEASRREAIKGWSEGLRELCLRVAEEIGGKGYVQEISSELNCLIYQVSSNAFIWLSLAKSLDEGDYDRAIGKVSKVLAPLTAERGRRESSRGLRRSLYVLLLKPEGSPAFIVKSKVRENVEFKFEAHELTSDELIALLGMSGRYGVPKDVSDTIGSELARHLSKTIILAGAG